MTTSRPIRSFNNNERGLTNRQHLVATLIIAVIMILLINRFPEPTGTKHKTSPAISTEHRLTR